jgi:hypothetical protein
MKFEIDLEGALASALSPEKLSPVLEKHVLEAVNDSLRDATGYGSDFRKALKAQLNELMPHGLALDEVAKFQHLLNAALTRCVMSANTKTIDVAMAALEKEVLPDLPAIIKVTDLMKEARKAFRKEWNEAFYAYFDPPEFKSLGGCLYLDDDEEPGVNRFSSGYRSGSFDRRNARHQADFRISMDDEGRVYAMKYEGQMLRPSSLPHVQGRFDSILMALYTGRCRVDMEKLDDGDIASLAGEQEPD